MNKQQYPYMIQVFKGEGRFFIIPMLKHIAGYYIDSDWYRAFDYTAECYELGKSIFEAMDVAKNNSIATTNSSEPAAWEINSKYKSWRAFSNHNIMVRVNMLEDNSHDIWPYSGEKSWHILLPETATAEEIGKAILDMFDELEKMGVKNVSLKQ